MARARKPRRDKRKPVHSEIVVLRRKLSKMKSARGYRVEKSSTSTPAPETAADVIQVAPPLRGVKGTRGSMREIFETVIRERKLTIKKAVLRGVKSGPRDADRYLRLMADYVDTKPAQTISHQFDLDEVAAAKSTLTSKIDDFLKTALLVAGTKKEES